MEWMLIETCPIKPFDKEKWFQAHSDTVLLWVGRTTIGSYGFTEKGKGRWQNVYGNIKPTHWMPLPEPPQDFSGDIGHE